MPTRAVLNLMLDDPRKPWYALELARATGLPSGTLSPMMARLTAGGWVRFRWERLDASTAGRPARKYYRLTAAGRRQSAALLDRPVPVVPRR